MRFAVEIAYHGAGYHGWQKQDNASSVQEAIETAMTPLLESPARIHGCGRTDTGVHAKSYYFHFDGDVQKPANFVYSLNQILDKGVAVKKLYEVPADFHCRYDAVHRTYRYFIHRFKEPFTEGQSWWFKRALAVDAMNEACQSLLQYDDFGSFCKSQSQNKTNICDVQHAKWIETSDGLCFEIRANRFLRNMVRAIVGTLLEIGVGKMNLNEFNRVIEARDRREAGFSVPAHGLFLWEVKYDQSNWKLINQGKELGTEG